MSMLMTEIQPGVRRKLGGRVDQNANLNIWIAEAVLELSQNYPFTELLVTGPTVPFQQGVASYDRNYWTQANEGWTNIRSWFLFYSGQSGPGVQVKGRVLTFVESRANIPGYPFYWSESDAGSILVGYCPDQAYYSYQRYQRVNPFTLTADNALAPADTDTVYMPNDWQEIIEYAAAIRGASELRAFDYVNTFYTMLHGDDEYRTSSGIKGKPGLIAGRISSTQRNINNFNRQLNVVSKRY